jgi:mannose-6-phosphate isomerase-like protein (cupin superfamily)
MSWKGSEMSTSIEPFAVQSGEGTLLETPTGDSVCVKTNTRNTHGSLTVLEFVISPKNGPALHTHLREDEVWYVLDGDFRFKAGDDMFWVSKGGMAFGPRGTPHNFQNVGDAPGRLLVITAPSGAERLFEEYAELLPGPVDPETLAAIGRANWVEFVGPQLKDSHPNRGHE